MTPELIIRESRNVLSPRLWRRFAIFAALLFPPAIVGAIYVGMWLWNLNIDGFSKVVFFILYAVGLFVAFVIIVEVIGGLIGGVEPYKQDKKGYKSARWAYLTEAKKRSDQNPGTEFRTDLSLFRPSNLSALDELGMPEPPNPLDYYKPADRVKMEAHAGVVARKEAEIDENADWKREQEYKDRLKKLGKPPNYEILEKQESWRKRQYELSKSSMFHQASHSGVHLPAWFSVTLGISNLIRWVGFGIGVAVAVGSVILGSSSTIAFPFTPSGYLPGLWGGVVIAILAFVVTSVFIDLPAVGLLYLTDGTKRELKQLRQWQTYNSIDDPLLKHELESISSVRWGISFETLGLKKRKIRGVIDPDEFELRYQLDVRELNVLRAARDGGFIDSIEEDQEQREKLEANTLRDQKWEAKKYAVIQAEQDAWEARKRIADSERTPLQVAWEEKQSQQKLDELCVTTFKPWWKY